MTASLRATGLKKYIPILGWLPVYRSSWLRSDLMAGVTTAAVVIPQAMAYATLAGLPVEVGLYASLTPMVVYALLGTSRVLSVSVTSTISLLTASVLATSVSTTDPGEILVAAGTLAVMVGLLLILAGILRLGFLANFISAPVLAGFKAGIGVVILVGQIGKALGFAVPKGGFVQTMLETIRGLDEANGAAILITLLVLGILVVLPRFARRIPAALLAVAVGMWPRGEVGAGILVLSLSYGIGGPIVTVAMLSLTLNLVLTGVFILIVKRLIHEIPEKPVESAA